MERLELINRSSHENLVMRVVEPIKKWPELTWYVPTHMHRNRLYQRISDQTSVFQEKFVAKMRDDPAYQLAELRKVKLEPFSCIYHTTKVRSRHGKGSTKCTNS